MEGYALLKLIAPYVVAGAAAWGGVKVGLNGTKERVTRLEGRLDQQSHDYHTIVEAVARLETKMDLILQDRIKHG